MGNLRNHRNKAAGKKIRFKRLPKPDEQKLGTKIYEEKEKCIEEATKCIKCDNWCGTDDLENGLCYDCIKEINFTEE